MDPDDDMMEGLLILFLVFAIGGVIGAVFGLAAGWWW